MPLTKLVCTKLLRLHLDLLTQFVWRCFKLSLPWGWMVLGAWQMTEMACSMLPSETSLPGMAESQLDEEAGWWGTSSRVQEGCLGPVGCGDS